MLYTHSKFIALVCAPTAVLAVRSDDGRHPQKPGMSMPPAAPEYKTPPARRARARPDYFSALVNLRNAQVAERERAEERDERDERARWELEREKREHAERLAAAQLDHEIQFDQKKS